MLGRCRQYGDPRLLEVTEERNGPSGLRDDDDDDDSEMGDQYVYCIITVPPYHVCVYPATQANSAWPSVRGR